MAIPAVMMVQRPPLKWDYASEPKEDVTECNACGSKIWVTLAQRDRYGLPIMSHCCHSCGLIFLSPRMTKEAYAEFYRDGMYRELIQWWTPGDKGPTEESQTRYAKKIIPVLEPFVSKAADSVLDVGGSPGACAHAVASHFGTPHYQVVDPADGEAFEDWVPPAHPIRYDIILCCQTVDHLLDLRGSLEKMRSLLTDDGVLFIDILDILYMLRGAPRMAKPGQGVMETIIKVDHPYGLNEVTSMNLLWDVGLRPVRIAYQGSHIGFVCKKIPPNPGALRRWGHSVPILANVRKKEAEAK